MDEHERLRRAIAAFERRLQASGAARPRRAQLLRDLRPLEAWLAEHCRAAEAPGGTLDAVEVGIGRLSEVAAARRAHAEMITLAADIVSAVERGGALPAAPDELPRWALLAAAVRRHLVAETDLLQLRYTLDVGVVD